MILICLQRGLCKRLTLGRHKLADLGQVGLQVAPIARLQLHFEGIQGVDSALRGSPCNSSSNDVTGWLGVNLKYNV